jgi:hypothetical protein
MISLYGLHIMWLPTIVQNYDKIYTLINIAI